MTDHILTPAKSVRSIIQSASFKSNFALAEEYMPQVVEVLQQHIGVMVKVANASKEEDLHQATDLKLTIKGTAIGVRVRRDTKYRDITFRAFRDTGGITELDKLRGGYCDFYFYGWAEGGTFADWVIVDIGATRAAGLLDKERRLIMNKDGRTGFVSFELTELILAARK